MDNYQPHEHNYLDYGDEHLKCACGEHSEQKAPANAATRGTKLAPVNHDDAKHLNDPEGHTRLQDLKKEESKLTSRPTAAAPDPLDLVDANVKDTHDSAAHPDAAQASNEGKDQSKGTKIDQSAGK